MKIASTQNPQVKELCALKDSSTRRELGLFLVEGVREASRAIACKIRPKTLYYCTDFLKDRKILNTIRCHQVELSKAAFEKASLRQNPDGILLVCYSKDLSLEKLAFTEKRGLILVATGIEKPGNLGTILRSCDASGVDALLIADARCDLFNPSCIRASMGACFSVPVAAASSDEVRAFLSTKGYATLAATPHAKELFWNVPMKGKVAIIMGTEDEGLSAEWMEKADCAVRVPMNGLMDSLNVASCTTLLLYEALRQKSV